MKKPGSAGKLWGLLTGDANWPVPATCTGAGCTCTASSGCPDSHPICKDGQCSACISNGDQGLQCAERAVARASKCAG